MKKFYLMAAVAMMAAMCMSVMSCADAEEGENSADWKLRNTINGPAWHVDMLKDSNGKWLRWEEALIFYFDVKFSASNHNFKSEKFYYVDGMGDDTTRERYSEENNTAYAIKDAKIIEATVDGNPYFRITLHKEVTSSMECTLYFYKENKAYEVIMTR